jgi:hypothetical protein
MAVVAAQGITSPGQLGAAIGEVLGARERLDLVAQRVWVVGDGFAIDELASLRTAYAGACLLDSL